MPPLLLLAAALVASPAVEVRRLPAAEARQGVAADRDHVYAVSDSAVAKYDKASGRRVGLWQGDPRIFHHINSCIAQGTQLVCAGSNYPGVPMTSMAVWIDSATMTLMNWRAIDSSRGSLTWLDWHDGAWWGCFANYDGKGGAPGRDHRATMVVRFDRNFVARRNWLLPPDVLDRMSPRSASGGAWGDDGLLYVSGHDRPEIYALRVPAHGAALEHVATVAVPTQGQAIAWDPARPRTLWSIGRDVKELVESRVPPIPTR